MKKAEFNSVEEKVSFVQKKKKRKNDPKRKRIRIKKRF